jgi:hypothetical protein
MTLASVYPLYLQKIEKKGRTKQELDEVIFWLTGYNKQGLQNQLDLEVNFEDFFAKAPAFHANALKITGVICGQRVEEIEEPVIRKVRYLDKLVDELAKGKALSKILRP